MKLEAKEFRMVILGLKSLLKETESKLKLISEESDEYSELVNDAMLIETMILGLEGDYQVKWG
jgi:hypothetical protein